MKVIPPAAFAGFSSEQFVEIDYACKGITSAQFPFIPPATIAGVTKDCVFNFNLADIPLSAITPDQFKYLSMAAWLNMWSDEVAALPDNVCPLISQDQLLQMTDVMCYGFWKCLPLLNPEMFQYITPDCADKFVPSAWTNVNAAQIQYLLPSVFEELMASTADDFEKFSLTVFSALSMSQLTNMSSDGFEGVSVDMLKAAIDNYGAEFVNSITNKQWSEFPLMDQFVSLIPGTVNYMPQTLTLNASTTWLQIALLPPQSDSFFSSAFFLLSPQAIGGLRVDQFNQIPADQFQNITLSQAYYVQPSIFSLLTTEQLNSVSPDIFKRFSVGCFNSLSTAQWQSIQPSVVSSFYAYVFEHLSCSILNAFTTDQVSALSTNQQITSYYSAELNCQNPTMPPTTSSNSTTLTSSTSSSTSSSYTSSSSSTSSSTSTSSTSSTSTSSTTTTTTTSGKTKMTKNEKKVAAAFGSGGIVLGALVVGVIAFVVFKKRSHRFNYNRIE